MLAVSGSEHPDGAIVDVGPAEVESLLSGSGCYLRAALDAEGIISAVTSVPAGATQPEVWFVEVRESRATPPAVNLVAFTGRGLPDGALLDQTAASNVGVSSTDQLGAVRWWPATGEVDQIYVSPDWRRHRIGTRLVLTAGCLAIARGWSRLWSDGQRTELGERFRDTADWRHRTADLTHLAPPMTPPISAQSEHSRNVYVGPDGPGTNTPLE
ncbi:hypothetical protein BH10ACT8_BH10ACT8_18560 [soil metagenome]